MTKLHSLQDIRDEYRRLDELCGVDTSSVPVRISTRSYKQYGACRWRSRANFGAGGYVYTPYEIVIADFILETEEAFWDTIRHEYAHALVTLRDGANHGHDEVWEAACREVGCRPCRVSFDRDARSAMQEKRKSMEKYEVRCSKCGQTWRYQRAGRVVKQLKSGGQCFHRACGCKTTLVAELLKRHPEWTTVESYTDRAPRYEGESGHVFVTAEEFTRIQLQEGLVAYTEYAGHRYGITSAQADATDLYVVDPRGVKTLRRIFDTPTTHVVGFLRTGGRRRGGNTFLLPRLKLRGVPSPRPTAEHIAP